MSKYPITKFSFSVISSTNTEGSCNAKRGFFVPSLLKEVRSLWLQTFIACWFFCHSILGSGLPTAEQRSLAESPLVKVRVLGSTFTSNGCFISSITLPSDFPSLLSATHTYQPSSSAFTDSINKVLFSNFTPVDGGCSTPKQSRQLRSDFQFGF